jgi:hypothetical protein
MGGAALCLASMHGAAPTRMAPTPSMLRRMGRGRPLSSAWPGPALAATGDLEMVLERLDKLNSEDPRKITVNGQEVPYELAYSYWLTEWVLKLTDDGDPPRTEELLIVARGQHVQRWLMPRSSYPEGRTSYLKWREDLKKMHAKVHACVCVCVCVYVCE